MLNRNFHTRCGTAISGPCDIQILGYLLDPWVMVFSPALDINKDEFKCEIPFSAHLVMPEEGLEFASMKGAIAANYGHGSYLSGDRLQIRQELFRQWLNKQPDDFFVEISEQILEDKQAGSDFTGEAIVGIEELMETPGVRKRGMFATDIGKFIRTVWGC